MHVWIVRTFHKDDKEKYSSERFCFFPTKEEALEKLLTTAREQLQNYPSFILEKELDKIKKKCYFAYFASDYPREVIRVQECFGENGCFTSCGDWSEPTYNMYYTGRFHTIDHKTYSLMEFKGYDTKANRHGTDICLVSYTIGEDLEEQAQFVDWYKQYRLCSSWSMR